MLSGLLCLVIGSALPISLVLLAVRRGWRQLAVAESYHAVARQLGLPADTRGVSLQGHLGVQRLWVGDVMVGHGPERRTMCWAVLDHERPLGLGIQLQPRRRFRVPWRRDDGDLERALEVRGDDAEGARQLLRDPTVRLHLERTMHRWPALVLTDDHVQVRLRSPLSRSTDLFELVDDLRSLSAAVVTARDTLGPPAPLADTVAQWSALAQRLGLEVEDAYPAIGGAVDGRRLRVWPTSNGAGFAAELRVVFRPHRAMGLQIAPQLGPDGYWSVGQDIQVGDTGFDRLFVIKGWDPAAVRDLLTDEVREHLTALRDYGRLEIDDVRLTLRDVRLDLDVLGRLLERAVAVATAMGW